MVSQIKSAGEKADKIFLSTDPDREGEAIAWHLKYILGKNGKKTLRATFQEITPQAVKQAIQKAGQLNLNLVNAQQARRILDRIVGYKISPMLWQFRKGLSAGRVQSATLHLVVEREKEILGFNPEEYWVLKVKYNNGLVSEYAIKEKGKFQAKKLENKEQTEKIISLAKQNEHLVKSIEGKKTFTRPKPPFTTSTLQQAASSSLGFKPAKTMRVAQKLFEGGHITYHRTDAVFLSSNAIQMARQYINENYSESLPDKPPFYRAKAGAQEAHEAIRPTTPKNFISAPPDELKLYQLIFRRFIASQCKPAEYFKTFILTQAGEVHFIASGSILTFPGYLKFYAGIDSKDKDEQNQLPMVKEGEKLLPDQYLPEQKFTKPPPRFTEASLIKEMEKCGIGRPSTYAATVQVLFTREYILSEKKNVYPSELGSFIDDLLDKGFNQLVLAEYTAGLEEKLDLIAEGKLHWTKFLEEWFRKFAPQLDVSKVLFKDLAKQKGADFKVGGGEAQTASVPKVVRGVKCPECEGDMVERKGKYGKFYGCAKYPACKGILDPKRSKKKAPKIAQGIVCPNCGGEMVERKGKYGAFYGCKNYPKCKGIVKK